MAVLKAALEQISSRRQSSAVLWVFSWEEVAGAPFGECTCVVRVRQVPGLGRLGRLQFLRLLAFKGACLYERAEHSEHME